MRILLDKCSYRGSELEDEVLKSNEMFTFQNLSSKIQASDGEMKSALEEIGAFQIDGNVNVFIATILI